MTTTHFLAPETIATVEPLLASHPYKPLYYYPARSERARVDYFRWVLGQQLSRETGFALVESEGGHLVGLVAGEMREWDSRAIGLTAAMVGPIVLAEDCQDRHVTRRRLLEQGLDELRRRGARHVTTRCEADDLEYLHLLEASGFITVDSIVHLVWNLRTAPAPAPASPQGILLRNHRPDDVTKLRAIARAALRADRFHGDPAVNQERAHEAYATWVENACRGLDDVVAVAVKGAEPVGFMTGKILPQTKELLGTCVGKLWIGSLTPEVRGQGLYGTLAAFLIQWFAEHGVDAVEGGTQTRNIPALRSLCRRGLLPANSMTTLRILL